MAKKKERVFVSVQELTATFKMHPYPKNQEEAYDLRIKEAVKKDDWAQVGRIIGTKCWNKAAKESESVDKILKTEY